MTRQQRRAELRQFKSALIKAKAGHATPMDHAIIQRGFIMRGLRPTKKKPLLKAIVDFIKSPRQEIRARRALKALKAAA